MTRYHHRTIDGVRLSIDVDGSACVVHQGQPMLHLGKVCRVGHIHGNPYDWWTQPGPDIKLPPRAFRTQGEGLSYLLSATAWVR